MIPTILDTDLGSDFDDHWAIVMMLGCKELDVKLITTDSGDTVYRAQLLAGLLTAAGRTDIPIGVGPRTELPEGVGGNIMSDGAALHPLGSYPGEVYEDGAGAMIDTIMRSSERITLITIGPVSTVAAALDREPRIAQHVNVISMASYLRHKVSFFQAPPAPGADYNVVNDVPAFRRLLEAEWPVTFASIDTCASIILSGEKYKAVRDSDAPLIRELMHNYDEWVSSPDHTSDPSYIPDPEVRSSVLWDTLAVLLAYSQDFVEVEEVFVSIDDEGTIFEDPHGRPARAALRWRDLDGFFDHLIQRLEYAASH